MQNPRVVDLISADDASGEIVLVMLEERPWGTDAEQLRQLEAKFNAYLEYVLGGHMAKQYPDYADKPVCIQLDCAENPKSEDAAFFTAMDNFAAGEGIRWLVRVTRGGGS